MKELEDDLKKNAEQFVEQLKGNEALVYAFISGINVGTKTADKSG